MTAALRIRRLTPGLVAALFLAQVTVAGAGQSGHDAKPSVAPVKPSITPPRMTQQDVTKPAVAHGREAAPEPAKAAEHSKPAGNAAPAEEEDAKAAGTTRATRHTVTPGPARRKSAERAVAALGAALSARRERVTRHEAALPPPPPPPAAVRRLAPRRRAALVPPPPPPPPRVEVPWPSRIVDVHWATPSEHRAVSWPSERPEPIELRWDLEALQSDLSEPTAAVTR